MEDVKKINDELTIVTGQVTLEQLQKAAQEGFKSVMNLRSPDEEGFLTEEQQQADAVGLHYVNSPVLVSKIDDELTDQVLQQAGTLYDSVTKRLFSLPDATLVYPAHDYRGQTVSTIGEEKRWNPRFAGRDRSSFIDFMANLHLPDPKKMMEAVPANDQCGSLMPATA